MRLWTREWGRSRAAELAGLAELELTPMRSAGAAWPVPAKESKEPRQVLEGYVKGGVVHPLEGELPDGIFVKIVRE